jgi:hypothetical protein
MGFNSAFKALMMPPTVDILQNEKKYATPYP